MFNQTMTYSGDKFDEKSIKIEVPPHQGGGIVSNQLTVVMHAANFGYWHYSSLKVNSIKLFFQSNLFRTTCCSRETINV